MSSQNDAPEVEENYVDLAVNARTKDGNLKVTITAGETKIVIKTDLRSALEGSLELSTALAAVGEGFQAGLDAVLSNIIIAGGLDD